LASDLKDSDLRREEVRGVFAIGVIAALFTVDQLFGTTKFFDVTVPTLTGYLLFFWLFYVLLTAVGVSEDIFGQQTSRICLAMGRSCFMVGIAGSAVILISAPVFYFRDHHMILQESVGLVILASLAVYAFVKGIRTPSTKSNTKRGPREEGRRGMRERRSR
jgi:hypothetical protein